jgi:GNAT superfamily N-acetyltransferase
MNVAVQPPPDTIDVAIAKESWFAVVDELKPILHEHWEELALYSDIPLDPEYELYETLETTGMLSFYSVRRSGELVGYAIFFVRRSPHYRTVLWAISDIILIRKPFRNFGVGNKLFDFFEDDLRQQGAKVVHVMTKASHPELAALARKRGYMHSETNFSKRL